MYGNGSICPKIGNWAGNLVRILIIVFCLSRTSTLSRTLQLCSLQVLFLFWLFLSKLKGKTKMLFLFPTMINNKCTKKSYHNITIIHFDYQDIEYVNGTIISINEDLLEGRDQFILSNHWSCCSKTC